MYGTLFSKVYDAFGWNFYPEEFAELLLKWMQENEIRVERMLDIGCGTGVLCHVLQEHGIKVHGMDLSEGMIEVARRNYPEIPFEQGNMITYDTPLRFDLVTSTCDESYTRSFRSGRGDAPGTRLSGAGWIFSV